MGSRWFIAAFNKEPAMMIAAIIAGFSVALPSVVVPIRRRLGLPTYQWDADAATHPYLHEFSEEQEKYHFNDATLLSQWATHEPYKFRAVLAEKSPDDPSRDFPTARARMATKATALA